jgi:uncharacterized protein YceK
MRTIVLFLGVLGLVAGCGSASYSNPYASPDTSRDASLKADCDRVAGYWNPNAHVCEAPLYRW